MDSPIDRRIRLIDGSTAVIQDAGETLGGASMLLRSPGIEPPVDPIDSYRHHLDKVWEDRDSPTASYSP